MKLLITDVTEMHAGNYCVAGWRAATATMVRPLPNGANWTAASLAHYNIAPGAIIKVQANGHQPNGAYPHRTEDTPIDPATIHLVSSPPFNWMGVDSPAVSNSFSAAFAQHLTANSVWNGVLQGVYVPANTVGPSLGALRLHKSQLLFTEDFGKLKVIVNDGQSEYKIAVSSAELKEVWRTGGIAAVNHFVPNQLLHVRVGLARAFGNPPTSCYAMLNGIHW
jgi:hypothetical protein